MENPKIFDLPELRNRVRVFRDRASAGKVLAGMLKEYRSGHATVMGIPAGGIAVAVEIARALDLPLDVAVVSKITLPWNSEAGYGAVAFDGTVMLNEELLSRLNLSHQEIQTGIKKTEQKVLRRVTMFREGVWGQASMGQVWGQASMECMCMCMGSGIWGQVRCMCMGSCVCVWGQA